MDAQPITATFTVQFEDEFLIAYETLDEPLATFKVTLTGTREQIAGFICLFFAQYGGSGLGAHEMQALSHLWDDHYHFDRSTEDIEALQHRHVMYLSSVVDYGVIFSTNNLAEFVSGMLAVPLSLANEGGRIEVLGVDAPNWFQTICYLDLTVDEQHDSFCSADPFAESILLSTVAIGQAKKALVVVIERQ